MGLKYGMGNYGVGRYGLEPTLMSGTLSLSLGVNDVLEMGRVVYLTGTLSTTMNVVANRINLVRHFSGSMSFRVNISGGSGYIGRYWRRITDPENPWSQVAPPADYWNKVG